MESSSFFFEGETGTKGERKKGEKQKVSWAVVIEFSNLVTCGLLQFQPYFFYKKKRKKSTHFNETGTNKKTQTHTQCKYYFIFSQLILQNDSISFTFLVCMHRTMGEIKVVVNEIGFNKKKSACAIFFLITVCVSIANICIDHKSTPLKKARRTIVVHTQMLLFFFSRDGKQHNNGMLKWIYFI